MMAIPASAEHPLQIDWLGAQPQHVRRLADWHVRAFADWVSGWQLEQAEAELLAHTRSRAVPTTLIALDGDTLLGSVSLLSSDLPAPDRYAPWLGSLYVRPESRRRGIGAALVRAAIDEAGRLGLPVLHLWTPDQAGFYVRLGWQALGAQRFGGLRAQLLRFDCPARPA
jgi:predicted N-acetyltransferase YhbS